MPLNIFLKASKQLFWPKVHWFVQPYIVHILTQIHFKSILREVRGIQRAFRGHSEHSKSSESVLIALKEHSENTKR